MKITLDYDKQEIQIEGSDILSEFYEKIDNLNINVKEWKLVQKKQEVFQNVNLPNFGAPIQYLGNSLQCPVNDFTITSTS